jgi:hypothetical protein
VAVSFFADRLRDLNAAAPTREVKIKREKALSGRTQD